MLTSKQAPSPFDFKTILSAKDVQSIAEQMLKEKKIVILDYSIRPYCEEQIGFLASHKRLEIKIRNFNETITNLSFFVKIIPYDQPDQASYIKDCQIFYQETGFFKKLVPQMTEKYFGDVWGPQCYLAKDDVLVLEDLSSLGFSMRPKVLNEELLKSGLKALANLHAASLVLEKHLGQPLNQIYPDVFAQNYFATTGNQYCWYRAGVDVAIKVAEIMGLSTNFISSICDQVYEAIKPSKTKQNVISHGDLWSNNLLFDNSSPPNCRLVDFQLLRYAPFGHDIAQFLYLCSSRQIRDTKGLELIKYYHNELKNCLNFNLNVKITIPSWNELLQSYEEQKVGAVVTAVLYFPTVLLDGKLGAQIMNTPELYVNYRYKDRRDIVLENMEKDSLYNLRMREIIEELVELSLKLDSLPRPS
ncbi:uncharacterized protein [Chelonus insularis]|uniref:uncharacterized protein n=1 Tax=Chelonus insularis TaxID=460826 RepID=UPI001588EB88|nr:uncharacterized protein LOC118074987 [Chelonus insularis]